MTECVVCDWIRQKKNLLFEDDDAFVMLAAEPCAAGHVLVIPKKHAPIIEMLPDDMIGNLFVMANKAGICAFEALGAKGVNLLIQNGIPAGQKHSHSMLQVIPRFENDGLKLSWEPSQLSADELSDIERKFLRAEPAAAAEERVESFIRIP